MLRRVPLAIVFIGALASTYALADVEKKCKNSTFVGHTGGACTITKHLSDGTDGCQNHDWKVTAVTCQDKITTYPDAACNGDDGDCSPPSPDPSQEKKITETGTAPTLALGCYNIVPPCSCTYDGSGGVVTEMGRVVCQ